MRLLFSIYTTRNKISYKMWFSSIVNIYLYSYRISARSHLAPHVDRSTVENQRYRCSFMQTAHYSISEIIVADTTDNDAIGKNRITRVYRQQFMCTYLIYN